MGFELDREIVAGLISAQPVAGERPSDVFGWRAFLNGGLVAAFAQLPDAPDVRKRRFVCTSSDGAELELHWYGKAESPCRSAVLYAHGGGMVAGSIDIYEPLMRHYVEQTGVPFLAVGYRLAPECGETGLARDLVAGLKWLRANAADLGVDPSQISIMGDSGGGGVAAAACILARDEQLPVARQLLVYPMLDDRNVVGDDHLADVALWKYDSHKIVWDAVLGGRTGAAGISPYISPARLEDFRGLPPAYIEVGELDIFRDEALEYARKLGRAGVSCEFHMYPGAPHGHDWLNLSASVSKRSLQARMAAIRSLASPRE